MDENKNVGLINEKQYYIFPFLLLFIVLLLYKNIYVSVLMIIEFVYGVNNQQKDSF